MSIVGYMADSLFFKMGQEAFTDYVGGQLAIALFKGNLRSELYSLILMAQARGIMYEMEKE